MPDSHDASGYDGPDRRQFVQVVATHESPVTTWSRAIAQVGIPGAIACFVVYILALQLPELSKKVEANTAATNAVADLYRQHVAQQDEALRLQRGICYSLAKDENARRICLGTGER